MNFSFKTKTKGIINNSITVPNKGCNQFGMNGLRKRVGTQETF